MRFIVMAMLAKDFEAGTPPDPAAFAAMQEYNEKATKAGILLAAEGLSSPSKAVRVTTRKGERLVTDGPFTEAKEIIAGFCIIKAGSMNEAIEWVKNAPNTGDGVAEIRKLMDFEDFDEMLDGNFRPNEEIAKVKF